MAKIKNELKGKQRVLDKIIESGETIELNAEKLKASKIQHALKTGMLSVVKAEAKQTKAK